jgi:hypothetical protein
VGSGIEAYFLNVPHGTCPVSREFSLNRRPYAHYCQAGMKKPAEAGLVSG